MSVSNNMLLDKVNEYHVYRILEIIHYKEYVNSYTGYYKRQNVRRNRPTHNMGFSKHGCLCSAAAINHMLRGRNSKICGMHEDILWLKELGLVLMEEHHEKPQWYTRLELTEKGKRYLELYEKLLELVNYFDSMGKSMM